MAVYKIKKESDRYYIVKKVLWWWKKMPDKGWGWGIKNMMWIEGITDLGVAEMILKDYEKK